MAVFVLVVAGLIAVIASCGAGQKVCFGPHYLLIAGTLETISCGKDVITKVTPKWKPGGQIITHLEVECKPVVRCE